MLAFVLLAVVSLASGALGIVSDGVASRVALDGGSWSPSFSEACLRLLGASLLSCEEIDFRFSSARYLMNQTIRNALRDEIGSN